MDITVIIASIVVFLAITFVLVGMLLGVKARLLPSGPVKLFINGETDVEVSSGSTLLSTLGDNKIFLPTIFFFFFKKGIIFLSETLGARVDSTIIIGGFLGL